MAPAALGVLLLLCTIENIRVWVDYISIPQRNRSEQKLAIASLPTFASCCDFFIVVAPDAVHHDTGCACNSRSYRRRAWCRAEIMSCWARNGTSDMYHNSNEGLKPLEVSDQILAEALDVIGGEFTCCRLGHPNEEPCDREQLMLPLLGLYADVYMPSGAANTPTPTRSSNCESISFSRRLSSTRTGAQTESRPRRPRCCSET